MGGGGRRNYCYTIIRSKWVKKGKETVSEPVSRPSAGAMGSSIA